MDNQQEQPGYTLVFFQKNPKAKPTIFGIFSLESDGKVWLQTKETKKPFKSGSLVNSNGNPILANNVNYLKELARQSKLSQLTYEYTENLDKVAEYFDLLTSQ